MRRLLLPLVLSLLCACQPGPRPTAGMYNDLGTFHRAAGTRVETAQRWFDQGLVLLYAFHHDEAIRCFGEATKADPHFALGWWGIAAANGPHINNTTVPPERDLDARAAITRAMALRDSALETERALIEAQALRWGDAPPTDRRALDTAYAQAMREVWQRYPADADVGALTAEALMDLQPWDLWTRNGEAKGATLEIVHVLERTLELDSKHPMACHLYIHAMEASSEPQRALKAADALAGLVPGSGHLEHMPSHIYIRTGRHADAIVCNERAMLADAKHRDRQSRTGFIQLYVAHDAHFLAFAHMMTGESRSASAAADSMLARLPREFEDAALPLMDGYLPVRFHVMVRFGQWDSILAAPAFRPDALMANAVRVYARGVALTALGRLDEATRELAAFDDLLARMDDRYFGNNPARMVLRVPRGLLAGELAFARGDRDAGLRWAGAAVATEDSLVYDEPPDWMMPARHSYGAMLLEAERWPQAERVFREDLAVYAENGWSLFGLTRALRAQNRETEAAAAEARFRTSWKRADVRIQSPCLCQRGSGPQVALR